MLSASPLYHAMAFAHLLQALSNPSSVAFLPSFRASTLLDQARELGATVFAGVGAMAAALLATPERADDRDHRLAKMEFVPCAAAMQVEMEERFGVRVVGEMYGQTECNPATGQSFSSERKRTSSGRTQPYIDLAIVDDDDVPVPTGEVGEIVLRPRYPNAIFSGYWRQEVATLEAWRNLWHHTGDLGHVDADGFVTYYDRKKDALRRRGENVSSVELEWAIAAHPAIAAVAVHAVPSAMTEDDIKACIVPVEGATLDPHELFAFLKDSVPYYALPRYVEILDELPTNPLGRVLKHKLRETCITEATWDFELLGIGVTREERR